MKSKETFGQALSASIPPMIRGCFGPMVEQLGWIGFNSSAARRIPPVSVLGDEPPLPTKVGSSAATNEESPSLRAGGGFNSQEEIDPNDPDIRSAADDVWERAALNGQWILGAEKRVLPDGRVQAYKPQDGKWKTLGRI